MSGWVDICKRVWHLPVSLYLNYHDPAVSSFFFFLGTTKEFVVYFPSDIFFLTDCPWTDLAFKDALKALREWSWPSWSPNNYRCGFRVLPRTFGEARLPWSNFFVKKKGETSESVFAVLGNAQYNCELIDYESIQCQPFLCKKKKYISECYRRELRRINKQQTWNDTYGEW